MIDKIELVYLGHSGFVIDTMDSLLVFDYWEQKDKLLASLLKTKNRKVFFFSSHDHHDHYDKSIEKYKKEIEVIYHFVGWKTKDSKHTYIEPHQTKVIEDLKITTLKSNDAGVAFAVTIDGFNIFHGGDLAGWEDETFKSFTDEIDYLKEVEFRPDIAFLAITSYSGIIQKTMVTAARYFIDKTGPKYFVPMHGYAGEYLYAEFKNKNYYGKDMVICPEYPGQRILVRMDLVE